MQRHRADQFPDLEISLPECSRRHGTCNAVAEPAFRTVEDWQALQPQEACAILTSLDDPVVHGRRNPQSQCDDDQCETRTIQSP